MATQALSVKSVTFPFCLLGDCEKCEVVLESTKTQYRCDCECHKERKA